ncbi:MAG TPA: bifunctional phosphoribosylaminoimidazolecarboxamide formyltransferase/IMP cyclohydrolase, partial [Alphaproteobacteria bacterium]|nr:bifunctional phosphoribosylaminoimidazolecarboxamide formyltransferase/IMP cyclohydrolase [Alphaproteobacteria bacterium]
MPETVPVRRALISVSDKTGLEPLAHALHEAGVVLLSTGGTARSLREAGLPVTDVSAHTGFPEIMDGRVKTLHPSIHGGLLGVRDDETHAHAMKTHGIAPIDLLVVSLYPFAQTVAKGADFATCIENIDIGGPAMIRSAAKNHTFVTVLTDPADYDAFVEELKARGGASAALRTRMAAKAFAHTALYDSMISNWFAAQIDRTVFPARATFGGVLKETLRYGENPHQAAALYL